MNRILIIGCGLIGSSVLRAVHKKKLAKKIFILEKSKKIIDELYKIKPPFNVNKIAQLSAIESLKDYKFLKKSIQHNLSWSVRIKKFLESKNIKTNKISANFFLLDFDSCKKSANYVAKKLENKGIILRSMENYKMKNKLRMTIGSTAQNIKFIKEIKNILR